MKLCEQKGLHALSVIKAKAHVEPGDPWRKWTGTEAVHQGNHRVDAATARGIPEHPRHLRVFTQVMKGRGLAYLTCLERLVNTTEMASLSGIPQAISRIASLQGRLPSGARWPFLCEDDAPPLLLPCVGDFVVSFCHFKMFQLFVNVFVSSFVIVSSFLSFFICLLLLFIF